MNINQITKITQRPIYPTQKPLHFFKKHQCTDYRLLEKISELQSNFLGCLPMCFIDNIPKEEIGKRTKSVMETFEDFSKKASESIAEFEDEPSELKKLEEKLTSLTQKQFRAIFFNSGRHGSVYKISCENEDFALKVFIRNLFGYRGDTVHGAMGEIPKGIYLNQILPKERCSKFYCAKLSTNSSFDGGCFMLTGFEKQKDVNKDMDYAREIYAKGLEDKKWNKLNIINSDADNDGNIINRKIVDYGGIDYGFQNKIEAKYARIFYPVIKKKDYEKLRELVEKYKNDKYYPYFLKRQLKKFGFETMGENGVSTWLNMKTSYFFANQSFKTTKDDITALRILGADFSAFDNYDSEKLPAHLKSIFDEFFRQDL